MDLGYYLCRSVEADGFGGTAVDPSSFSLHTSPTSLPWRHFRSGALMLLAKWRTRSVEVHHGPKVQTARCVKANY